MMTNRAKDNAARLLVYYFRLLMVRAGVTWTDDHEAEIRGIVDDIVQAAVEP